MKRIIAAFISGVIFTVCVAIGAYAQNITGSIVGQINDSTGAGVGGATITVTNTATGISTKGLASGSGSYTVSDLQPGTYTVSVSAQGFSAVRETGIVLGATQAARVDVALKIGSTSQTVEVTGATPLIHTDSGSIEGTLNMHQIRELPASLQTISSLYAAVPGANASGPASNPQFAGTTHWGAANYSLNGVSLDDPANGGATYAYATGGPTDPINEINLPATDTLQEFRVVDINANAEFRDLASVIMVTKQGSNQFHGDAYESFQNADLNANSYTLNASGQPRAKDNLNQFGGAIGGPIWKNKVFFFFSPVYLRRITATLVQLAVPTQAEANGDFRTILDQQGTQLYNPFTGAPFEGNQIDPGLITSQARTLLKNLPVPTVANASGVPNGGVDYRESVPAYNSASSYTIRGDYQVRPSDSLFGVYIKSTGKPWDVILGGPHQYGNATDYGYRDQTASLAETHIFNPNVLNDFRASWFRHGSVRNGQNCTFDPTTLFPQLTPGANRGFPTMSASGYAAMFNDVGCSAEYKSAVFTVEFNDNFTKVVGRHTFKAGIDENGYKVFSHTGEGSLGSFSFSGVWTGNKGWPGQPQSVGNSFADFLLGTANAATRSTPAPDTNQWNRDYEAFVQDTWQATPRLTFYYGLRYMYQAPWSLRNNDRSFFDMARNKLALPEKSPTPTPPADANLTFYNTYQSYFETTQSIGLPLHYTHVSKDNWAPRIGFAFRPMPNTVIRGGYGIYYNFIIRAFGNYDANNIPFGTNTATNSSALPGKPASTYLPDVTFDNPFGSAVNNVSLNPTLYYQQPDLKNAMIHQWNLTAEHQFFGSWMARVSYVGSETHHLPWYASDINVPVAQIPNTTVQKERPFQPWATINSVRSGGDQSYNQLQLESIRRFSGNGSLQLEYAYTRSLDDVESSGGPQRPYLPALDWGNSTGIHRHQLVGNYLYSLPFGRGKKFLNHSNNLENSVVGGWRVSGITTYATGTPFSVGFSVPSTYVGWLGGRADRIPGVPLYIKGGGHNVIKGVPWLNPAAFGPPQPWTWGNSGRNILWGPGFSGWDISALKEIPLRNELHMVFRADFLNAFNHFNLGNPNATVASTQYGGSPIATSGLIQGGSGNRNIQLGARVTF